MSDLMKLQQKLLERKDLIPGKSFLTGFDGFIDQMINIVETRADLASYEPVTSMKRFGQMIDKASNRSSLREVVIKSVDIGGCAVNMGDGLMALGGELDFYGSTGKPMAGAFAEFAGQCRHFSSMNCDPGLTMAFEFEDGKYMMSSVNQLARMNRSLLKEEFKDGQFLNSARRADLIAFTNWTLYPHMTDCWAYVQESVLNRVEHRPHIFIDLVDPRSRSGKDIEEMLAILRKFESYGNTIFGGNLNEGNVLAQLLGMDTVSNEGEDVAELAYQIRKVLGLSVVVIHCVGGAAYADENDCYWEKGPYCQSPLKSTGAGDRFNAGFAMATVLDLEPRECLLFAGSVSGFFVRNGYSGSFEEIIELIEQWDRGEI